MTEQEFNELKVGDIVRVDSNYDSNLHRVEEAGTNVFGQRYVRHNFGHGNRRSSRKNPVTTRCGAPIRAILSHPHRWRGNPLQNLPPLFGSLGLEIARIVLYSLSSKRRPFCKV